MAGQSHLDALTMRASNRKAKWAKSGNSAAFDAVPFVVSFRPRNPDLHGFAALEPKLRKFDKSKKGTYNEQAFYPGITNA
ncbi:hypothetical protein [Methylovirgula sp. 4M-Z18]|uniref:hypothetical protein n=1 Tax=Methylovirgula sp. 4M-Z18 TaxID=2293567 RepID=UPI001AEC9C2B|nr:hypothetical protein [Methylovirgula sp. 4M-Z18]